jgi:hypothetical protein
MTSAGSVENTWENRTVWNFVTVVLGLFIQTLRIKALAPAQAGAMKNHREIQPIIVVLVVESKLLK